MMYCQQLRGWGEKTRQEGDSALIDIRTFVWHPSAYFWSERWVSSNPYFVCVCVGGREGLMKDVFDGEEWQQLDCFCLTCFSHVFSHTYQARRHR